jgi:hypothetical protein
MKSLWLLDLLGRANYRSLFNSWNIVEQVVESILIFMHSSRNCSLLIIIAGMHNN